MIKHTYEPKSSTLAKGGTMAQTLREALENGSFAALPGNPRASSDDMDFIDTQMELGLKF